MRTNITTICIAALASILLTNCSKDESGPETSAANFSPLTTGSNWTYKSTEGTSAATTFKLTVTNRDTVANGKTFKVLSSSDGTPSYMTKIGSDYYRFASFPSIGVNSFEELYLKDNKAVNETWAAATDINLGGFPLKVNLKYTIKGKGETRTVNGVAFKNVTHVRLDIDLQGLQAGGGDFYYQDGVGLIEDKIDISTSFGQDYHSTEEIIAYEIK